MVGKAVDHNSTKQSAERKPISRSVKVVIAAIILIVSLLIFLKESQFGFSTYPRSSFARLTVQRDRNDASKFHFSGHIMGSWNCLGPVKVDRSGDDLNLQMTDPFLCGSQGGGDFDHVFDTEGSVKRITYGRERTVLYTR